ncbi:MAG: hypothetical protein ABJC09_06355 [Terriglobia bacterium]
MLSPAYFAGLDLGRERDHAAIAVVERVDTHTYASPPAFHALHVLYLARIPLGTPYAEIVAGVRRLLLSEELRGRCALAVDSTGVGAPVVEMLKDAGLECEIGAVTISGGEREHRNGSFAGVTRWSVPKQDLISGLQLLLEKGQLRIAKNLPAAGSLVRELMDMRAVRKESGHTRLGADRSGEHDDLVIALSLAVWRARRRGIGFGTQRLPGI